MRRRHLLGIACVVMLTACAAPEYQGAPSDTVAQVQFANSDRIRICEGGTVFTLTPNGSGKVSVPAGRSVRLESRFRRNQGICFPQVKFTPQAGRSYEIVVEARDEQCFPTVVAYNPSAPNDVRVEPSTSLANAPCH